MPADRSQPERGSAKAPFAVGFLLLFVAGGFVFCEERRPEPAPPARVAVAPAPDAAGREADAGALDALPAQSSANEPETDDVIGFQDAFCDPPDADRSWTKLRMSRSNVERPEIRQALLDFDLARRRGDQVKVRRLLREAVALAPDEPWLLRSYGVAAARSADYADGARALGRYLELGGREVQLARLHRRLQTQVEIQAEFARLEDGGVTLDFPPELPEARAQAALQLIVQALEAAAQLLGEPRRPELYAIIYRDRSELLAVSCVPIWTGGFFNGTLATAMKDDHTVPEKTLRHEVMHAQLSHAARQVPTWLHEGLASAFDGESRGHFSEALDQLAKHDTYVPFSTMVESFPEEPEGAMWTYAQSLAMAEILLERPGAGGIRDALQAVRSGITGLALLEHLRLTEDVLKEHLARRPPR